MIERKPLLGKPTTRLWNDCGSFLRVFVDESGDEHLNIASGASQHYVLAAVIVRQEDLDQLVAAADIVRRHYFQTGEMKSSKIGNDVSRRCRVLQALVELRFHAVVFCVPKQRLSSDTPLRFAQVFLKYVAKRLCLHLPRHQEVEIVFDKKGRIKFQDQFKRYLHDRFPQDDLFNSINFDVVDSKENVLVQLADLYAGSVAKQYLAPDRDLLKLLTRQVTVWEWPGGRDWGRIVRGDGANEFDAIIRREAFTRAAQYLEGDGENEDEVSLRKLFLKWLIDQAVQEEDDFLFSDELSARYKSELGVVVDRQAIRNKIVGPLRDAGLLIASSAKGYRLPDSLRDMYRYVELCNTQIPPALSRLRRAREIVLSSTAGRLDILANDIALKQAVESFSPLA